MSACPTMTQLQQFLADELTAEQAVGLETHIEECLACQ